MEISRRGFVQNALGSAVAFSALTASGITHAAAPPAIDDPYYLHLVHANDAYLPSLLAGSSSAQRFGGARGTGEALCSLAAAYCAPESSSHHSPKILAALEANATRLLAAQNPDGTIDSGNLCSPPDTSFTVQTTAMALTVLRREAPLPATLVQKLEKFLRTAGEALLTGGIHTPNHRWVLSSALAQLNTLFPDPRYVARIDDWLGEGVFSDADGQFSERSTGIYSRVVDNAMITLARHLRRPALLEPVRRNLAMTLFYMHPNGELETVASRRQDQNMQAWISNYYLQYRYMALLDANPHFAAAARFSEQIGLQHAEDSIPLIQFLEEPLYRRPLPTPVALPTDYARFFPSSSLARIRRGSLSATVYGGSDWPLGQLSGLASNPTFFRFRKGQAILDSVRLMPLFFSEGAFRSAGMEVSGNRYILHQTISVPYYQPLPKNLRNPQGDYPLTPAGNRFWSKMNFPQRPISNVQSLSQKVTVTENNGAFNLDFEIGGHDRVPIVIELAFRHEGSFTGAEPGRSRPSLAFLRQGLGRFTAGSDTITFGPGQADHEQVRMEPAPVDAHSEGPQPALYRVYITAYTPFRKTLTIS
ncbi:MAG: hypothetical protein P4L03_00205 [Terracidiphilus sp.]|nr:hypothetical protein [Terracidiphilus sp.]